MKIVMMIRVFVRENFRGPWREVPNGPFPITPERLEEARRRYRAEWDACADPLGGIKMSPQTAARDILLAVAPHLNAFDRGMLGFAVSNANCRTEKL